MDTAVVRYEEFRYPQTPTLVHETRIPRHHLYHPKRSHAYNTRAFRRLLASLEALHSDDLHSHTTVFVTHDTNTCFLCEKTSDDMILLYHRKGSSQFLPLGKPPPEDGGDLYSMRGLYLRVDTSDEYNKEVPICPACFSTHATALYDPLCPATRKAECARAESIMYRHWQRGGSWDCRSTIFSPRAEISPGIAPVSENPEI